MRYKHQHHHLLNAMSTQSPSRTKVLTLPPELHLLLSRSLTYPDLMALKHTHPYFNTVISPTVYDRVDWLLERPRQGLPLPQSECSMKTDAQFCNHKEIRHFMERRRQHADCADKCLVIEGTRCNVVWMRLARISRCRRRRRPWIAGTGLTLFVVLVAWNFQRWL